MRLNNGKQPAIKNLGCSGEWKFGRRLHYLLGRGRCQENGCLTGNWTLKGYLWSTRLVLLFEVSINNTVLVSTRRLRRLLGFCRLWFCLQSKSSGFGICGALMLYPPTYTVPLMKRFTRMPPVGYPCSVMSNVLRLHRVLYGTKQAACCWWKFFSKVLYKIGCAYCVNNQSIYVLKHGEDVAVVWIHVDDGQICLSSIAIISYIWQALEKSFDLVWQDNVDQIVGIKIIKETGGFFFLNLRWRVPFLKITGSWRLAPQNQLFLGCN